MSAARASFVNAVGLKMIRVRAAPFDAWTPCFDDIWEKRGRCGRWTGTERPPVAHRVELDRDFYLGASPVTNEVNPGGRGSCNRCPARCRR